MAHGGRARGEMGWGHCGSKKKTETRKNLTTGLIWLVTRVGGWGEAWGWPMEGGQRGRWEGAPESSVGATKGDWVP